MKSYVQQPASFLCVQKCCFMNTRYLYLNSTLTLKFCSSIPVHMKSIKRNKNINHHHFENILQHFHETRNQTLLMWQFIFKNKLTMAWLREATTVHTLLQLVCKWPRIFLHWRSVQNWHFSEHAAQDLME